MNERSDQLPGMHVAVVGMALRVPGASSLDQFWTNLRDGVESISRLTPEALKDAGERPERIARDDYVPAAGLLDHVKAFDASVFGIGPRDAALMDPQHRHFLEVCWEALEHAGYDPTQPGLRVGVFGGSGLHSYFARNLLGNPELMESLGLFLVRHAGNDKDFLTTRVSYHLGLEGPSLNIQTACSTSLVAIHEAAQHLIAHECDMALAGGVTIEIPHGRGYVYRPGEVLSPDGHCRAFDDAAAGTVFGSGVGVVALRRLDDALRDRNTIYAVVRGSAVNNDGASKVSYLAPSVKGQADAIREALALSGVAPHSITYVEAHGTGTHLGDPIEVAALTAAFEAAAADTVEAAAPAGRLPNQPWCALGSVKTNIGHLDTAAGVASFIKVVLALTKGEIPATLHYHAPNRHIDFGTSPFVVNHARRTWQRSGGPRRAGVNSVGVGGTNAHVIVEEAPSADAPAPSRPWSVMVWSGYDAAARDRCTARLGEHLAGVDASALADAAYTLAVGRKAFGARGAMVVSSPADGAAALLDPTRARVRSGEVGAAVPSVAFMFPGGGAQYPGMARGLLEREPVFRAAFESALESLPEALASRVRAAVSSPGDGDDDAARALEGSAELSLPALFAVEYALAALWRSWGIEPDGLIGHSMGEYVAACLADVMSLADAMSVVTLRGRLFDALPAGAMVSVDQPEAVVAEQLPSDVSVAAVNSPASTVISGEREAVARARAALEARGAVCRTLVISVAAHSVVLEPVLEPFRQLMRRLTLRAPRVPFVSNVTGTWIRADEATDPEYWVRHLRQTVRFADGLGTLLTSSDMLLEVGPGHQLAAFARQHHARRPDHQVWTSLRHARESDDDQRTMLDTLARAWCVGVPVDWHAFFEGETRRRVAVPTYPFARTEHWIEPATAGVGASIEAPSSRLQKLTNLDDWFSCLEWVEESRPAPVERPTERRPWLIFADRMGIGRALAQRLRAEGQIVVLVVEGAYFSGSSPRELMINPQTRSDYDRLVAQLQESKLAPGRIVHLWSEFGPRGSAPRLEYFERVQDMGFRSLLYFLQACATADVEDVRVFAAASGYESLAGGAATSPEKATLLGLATVAPVEMPRVKLGTIDIAEGVDAPVTASAALVDALLGEVTSGDPDPRVALRRGRRFVPRRQPWTAAATPASARPIDPAGAYLITGGLTGLGAAHAEHLAQRGVRRLALVGRTPLMRGPRAMEALDHSPGPRERLAFVHRLEAMGVEVLALEADVSNRAELARVLETVRSRFGRLSGVFHAAGALADSPLALKSVEQVERVFAPKAKGAMLLDELLGDEPLDFLVLFSSTSAEVGIPGQVDYAAASAFLNAFAQERTQRTHQPTIAIGWGVWQDIGLAARAATQPSVAGEASLIGRFTSVSVEHVVSEAIYRAGTSPILAGHRLGGRAVLPGAATLTLAIAALDALPGPRPPNPVIVLDDLRFLVPLFVDEESPTSVQTKLTRVGDAYSYTMSARTAVDEWTDRVSARAAWASQTAPVLDVERLSAGLTPGGAAQLDTVRAQRRHLQFGPEWACVTGVRQGPDDVLAALSVVPGPDRYPWGADPAMLDVAITAILGQVDSPVDRLWVPRGCARVTMFGEFPRDVISHSHLRARTPTSVTVDVTLASPDGRAVATLEGLELIAIVPSRLLTTVDERSGVEAPRSALALMTAMGISRDEGLRALDRVLSSPRPDVMVSSLDLTALRRFHEPTKTTGTATPRFARPAHVRSTFSAATTRTEQRLTALWQEVLGIEGLGVHDNFFELGGDSLSGLRLFASIRRVLGVSLPIDTLFAAPTIATCAALIDADSGPHAGSAGRPAGGPSLLVPIQATGTRPPLYCVHEQNGYVLSYRELSHHLGEDQPFVGIQASGLDGSHDFDLTIEAMAGRYVRALLEAQPEGAFYLAGSSLGGLVAYEMARQLEQAGRRVAIVAMFDSWTPWALRPIRKVRQETNAEYAVRHVRELFTQGPRHYLRERVDKHREKKAATRAKAEMRARIARHLVEGTELPYELLQMHLEIIYERAYLTYVAPPYRGTVTLFRAMDRWHRLDNQPALGWDRVQLGGLKIVHTPGRHGFMVREPHVATLAALLRTELDAAMAAEATNDIAVPHSAASPA